MLSVIAVRFSRSLHIVNENDGPAQPILVLSKPSSTDITVKVLNTDITAIGEYYCTG